MFGRAKSVGDGTLSTVPVVDYSWQAHKVLISCIMVQGFLEGIPLCFGIFQNHYTHQEYPGYQNSSWIGDVAIGMLYLGAPLMTHLCEVRKMKPEHFVWAAWLTSLVALVTAAFCTTIPELIFTQGVLLGLSALLIEMPGLLILSSWWVERRGFAYGALFAFADIFGAGWGYLARYLLQTFGLRVAFLVFAAAALLVPGTAIWSFQSRPAESLPSSPEVEQETSRAPSGEPFWRPLLSRPLFWILIGTTCFQSFAYYVPSIYLPTYNMQVISGLIDCSAENTNLLAAFNLAQIPGEFAFGWLSDHVNVSILSIISSVMAALATFILWAGLIGEVGTNFGGLLAFATVFGLFGAGFLVLWGRMSESFGKERSQMMYSILSFTRGVATLASGPLSTALLSWGARLVDADVDEDSTKRGYESKYKALIFFVGSSMLLAAVLAGIGGLFERLSQSRVSEVSKRGSVVMIDDNFKSDEQALVKRKDSQVDIYELDAME